MAGVPGLLRAFALALRAGCAVQACSASLSNLFGSHPGFIQYYFFKNI